jgi:pimeloyl-ACP methyl ester carboxylesterase
MTTIYKKSNSKAIVLSLYDKQMKSLGMPYEDIFVETTFGKTHVVKIGKDAGKPLFLLHGGNSTTAHNLCFSDYLLSEFQVYAVDIIGHPGKSDEVSLSAKGYDYGKWASDVIGALGFTQMLCCAGSFGAGILAKLMCYAPEKVERVILHIPSGINNALSIKSMQMAVPMVQYTLTGKKSYLIKCILPMALTEENIDDLTYQTVKCIMDNVKVKSGMPSNVDEEDMKKCLAPTLVMAAELDCLFPASLVIPRAEKIIPNCQTYLVEKRGHLHALTESEKHMMVDFLNALSDKWNVM